MLVRRSKVNESQSDIKGAPVPGVNDVDIGREAGESMHPSLRRRAARCIHPDNRIHLSTTPWFGLEDSVPDA